MGTMAPAFRQIEPENRKEETFLKIKLNLFIKVKSRFLAFC
jgi:hypothetical protein